MRQVLEELDQLRRTSRAMLIGQRLAVVVAWVLAATLLVVVLDYLLRLPGALRAVMLAACVVALGIAAVRYVWPAIHFRPTLTQLALRVERARPALRGRLASSVEFSESGLDETSPLAGRSVREAQGRLAGESVRSILRAGPTVRDVALFVTVTAVVVLVAAVYPAHARTGLARLLLPYGATQWPARTAVASLMDEVLEPAGVHPRGQVLALRARNLTGGAEDDRVDVHYRYRRDGSFGPWQHALLTHQGGGVHERLVDTSAEAIELRFHTEDAATAPETVRLVPSPGVVRATAIVTPPAYAEDRVETLQADLGPGLDDRATVDGSCLLGARVTLTFDLTKPLPVPADPAERAAWLPRTFGWDTTGDDAPVPAFHVDPDAPARWRLSWVLDRSRTLALDLVDEHGLSSLEPIRYRIEATTDLPPSITITEPATEEAVLRTAVVPIAGEAKDDVAVARIGLTGRIEAGAGTAAPEDDPPIAAAEDLDFRVEEPAAARTATVAAALDLGAYDLDEGDTIVLRAFGDDVFELDGARHETVYSPPRRLRVISELDFSARLRQQLGAVRQNAIRVEALQEELQDDVREGGPQPGLARAQAEIGDRIETQRSTLDALREQLQRNRLDDEQLVDLIQQSEDLLEYAGRASTQAMAAMEGLESEPADGAAPEAAETQPVTEAQQEVRDELSDLIELLDRDEDTWLVQRQLEEILAGQRDLQEETEQLAARTIGRDLQDLTEEERTELDRIVRRQRELPEQLRRLIEEMRQRAPALDEVDPQAAGGMRTAADTAERREVDRDMERAAQRAGENQLTRAQSSQQSATRSLERMLEDLEETKRAQAAELLRQLASLIESIDRLVTVQENELIALAAAEADDDFTGRDRAMIRLNQNTQSVAADARTAGQQVRRIARTLDRAADAQGAAVAALRARPRDAAAAREAEERSLALLKEAAEAAQALEEETQEDQLRQQREELIAAYQALAERQVAVRGDASDLAARAAEAGALGRRELVEARQLATAQDEIGNGLRDVEASTGELAESDVFRFVHELLDRWVTEAADALRAGEVGIDLLDRQQMIVDAIARQIEALEESLTPPDEFAQDGGGGEGGGGGGSSPPPPLIPPVAEVRRVHGLQEQVYEETRRLDGRTDLSEGRRRERVRELGRMQRELLRIGEKLLEKMRPPGGGPADAGVAPPDAGPEGNPDGAGGADDPGPGGPMEDQP